ncbi:hypothetical protein ACP70R_000307 [Stipagrostis hirtigluma subsp. patula]
MKRRKPSGAASPAMEATAACADPPTKESPKLVSPDLPPHGTQQDKERVPVDGDAPDQTPTADISVHADVASDADSDSAMILEPKIVVISQRLVLQQILQQLKLQVHDAGCHVDVMGHLLGWLEVDLPHADSKTPDSKPKKKLRIYSDPCTAEEDVEENAAKAVVEYLCDTHGVQIHDSSYSILKKKEEEMAGSKFWADFFQDEVIRMRKQATANAHRYNALLGGVKQICHQFSDVVPLTMIPTEISTPEITHASFMATGDSSRPSRMDQLALALLKLTTGHRAIVPPAPPL